MEEWGRREKEEEEEEGEEAAAAAARLLHRLGREEAGKACVGARIWSEDKHPQQGSGEQGDEAWDVLSNNGWVGGWMSGQTGMELVAYLSVVELIQFPKSLVSEQEGNWSTPSNKSSI
jgi:hypothetical protein